MLFRSGLEAGALGLGVSDPPGDEALLPFVVEGAPGLVFFRSCLEGKDILINAVLWPDETSSPYFMSGGVAITGWLERQHGRWLDPAPTLMKGWRDYIPVAASWTVEPVGYADRPPAVRSRPTPR